MPLYALQGTLGEVTGCATWLRISGLPTATIVNGNLIVELLLRWGRYDRTRKPTENRVAAPQLANTNANLLTAGGSAQPKGCSSCFVPGLHIYSPASPSEDDKHFYGDALI